MRKERLDTLIFALILHNLIRDEVLRTIWDLTHNLTCNCKTTTVVFVFQPSIHILDALTRLDALLELVLNG